MLAIENLGNGLTFFEGAYPLILGDGLGLVPEESSAWQLWEGWSSFWFSDSEIGYLAEDNSGVNEHIMKANIDGSDPEQIVGTEEIITALPINLPMTGARLNWVQRHPLKPETLLIILIISTTNNEMPTFLLEYDLQDESGTILDIFESQPAIDFEVYSFSPNGRLGLLYDQDEANNNQLTIFDFENNSVRFTIANASFEPQLASWSENSEWLFNTARARIALNGRETTIIINCSLSPKRLVEAGSGLILPPLNKNTHNHGCDRSFSKYRSRFTLTTTIRKQVCESVLKNQIISLSTSYNLSGFFTKKHDGESMFDWQTEEDEVVWQDEPQTPPEEPFRPRLKWWVILLPLILLGGGYYLYLQIQEQTDTAVSAVEDDIVSSHLLLLDSVENQDRDLFELLLSGRDMNWVRTYDDLVQAGQFLDYEPFGLTYQPDSYELINIELTPAFDSANVDFSLAYLDEAGNEVRLRQTAVFRPGETRWLFAPPEAEFWGGWQTVKKANSPLSIPNKMLIGLKVLPWRWLRYFPICVKI